MCADCSFGFLSSSWPPPLPPPPVADISKASRAFTHEGTPCGEVQIIQEDLPSRTPRETVGRLAPLRNFAAPPPNTSQSEYLGCRDEDESDAISKESFQNAFLLTKRSLHHSDLVSHDGAGKIDMAEDCIGPLHSEGDKRNESGGLEMRKKELTSVTVPGKGVGQKKSSVSRFREMPRAFWPYWVYCMYDSYYLARKAADKWKQIVGLPSMDGLVRKPDLLSFYIASKIPVSESMRQELLEIDGISYRLRREIELLESFDCVRCKDCKNVIGKRSDMLMMSCEGPLGAYVNPHGCVHEIMTLREANGLFLVGGPVEEYSWFPGYAWTVAECVTCDVYIGWLFTATNKKLKPSSFWGIRSSQVADDMN